MHVSGKAAMAALAFPAWAVGLVVLHGYGSALPVGALVLGSGLALARHFAPGFTWANLVTSLRLALVAWVAGAVVGSWSPWLWVVAAVALALDGADGWIARKRGESSSFGARFDMEVDAAFIMLLSFLAWRLAPVGPWVMAMGALRYVYVVAAVPFPQLNAPLPPSVARKVVCVVQVLALLFALNPWVGSAWTPMVLTVALVALGLSFARDVIWCFTRGATTAKVSTSRRSEPTGALQRV